MLVKFLAHGTGSARKAANYLLGERDAAGKEREDVEVLRGDPHQVAAVADTLAFEHKYTSGVIAWAPEDEHTDEQIEAVLDAFESTAWAGLEPDRYAWTAVLHRGEDGGAHVHVLAARCDLETGRSLNIAPPGWEKTFGPLGDAFTHEHGWARPDDPARARVQQPGHRAYVKAAQVRAGLRLESSPRNLIRDYLLQRVEHGTVRNRHEVVAALREAGHEVPRQGKDYLTAMDPETVKRWRLKGELYAFDFERERLGRAAAETTGERTQGDRVVDRERARAARRELAARHEERARYHRARYGGGGRADARVAPQGVAPTADRRPESLARHLRRKLGDDALVGEQHPGPDRDPRRVVNDDGSITKGGIDIGNLAAPGPIGPTGTTGGDGSGGPGSGSGGGAVPDKRAPIFNPTGPQFEIWCMVRIWYIESTGEVLDAEILYCWDDGTGGGGSGGGGNNNNNNQQKVTFSLSCDPSVTRGRHASCRVNASTDDGEVDTDEFSFTWSSSLGASASGIGKDEWGGSSVEDVTVTVKVGGYSASKDISVRPRSNWGTKTLNESPRYRPRSFFRSGVVGNYILHAGIPRVPAPVEGSGPWDDVYRMPDNAPQVSTEMNVSSDYSSSGLMYSGARATCPPDSNNLQASASYWTVNGKCGTLNVLTSFRNSIIKHEEEHEDGYNRCIRSARAGRVMVQMEAETGTRAAVASATSRAWGDLYRNHIHGAAGTGNAFSSTGRYHWYDSRWYNATDGVRQDGGSGGC